MSLWKKTAPALVCVLALLSIAGSVDALAAADTEQTAEKSVGFDAALKVGGTFHTLFKELSPFVSLELEAGITFLNERLEVDLNVGWARPPGSSAGDDPRFADEVYDWELTQDFLSIAVLARYRFFDTRGLFNLYGGLGPKLYMLRTVAKGSASGENFGENRQYETRFGGVIVVGPELHVGPGAVGLEVAFGFGNLDGLITGDSSTTALDLLLGYRFLF